MSELCIQLEPDGTCDLAIGQVRRLCDRVARDRRLVARMRWTDVTLTRRFLTVQFTTPDPDALWASLRDTLDADPAGRNALQHALVIATGQRGWNDSRHLHPPISQVA